ncbi:MAG: LysM peptidoglycan-binding domain-containing protein [Bacteroidetes bacterium]|nr:LysM peptidoglycan-binding domain-containing protein [Bacteroidota bacterium]
MVLKLCARFRLWASILNVLVACGLWLVALTNVKATPVDSLRVEAINGKSYIIHRVDPKETLFSISRKYKVTVAEIVENNPKSDAGLSVGRELKIPYTTRTTSDKGNGTHKVAPKETLFSIAKMYDVSVDELKKWNNLTDNSIAIGQELIVKKTTASAPVLPSPNYKSLKGVHVVTEKESLFSISKTYGASLQQLREWNNLSSDELKKGQTLFVLPPVQIAEKITTQPVQPNKPVQEIKISERVIGSEEVHETGMAALMEGTEGGRKYLAQHKTAKVGSILKVRNEAAQREVFVRVIGTLSPSDEVVIKISKSAYDKLGATDLKFKVELIYYK